MLVTIILLASSAALCTAKHAVCSHAPFKVTGEEHSKKRAAPVTYSRFCSATNTTRIDEGARVAFQCQGGDAGQPSVQVADWGALGPNMLQISK